MINPGVRVFLDTSTIIAAVLSERGGARYLFQLGEVGLIQLVLGPNLLRECDEVVRRKVPASLPDLAYLLEISKTQVTSNPAEKLIQTAREFVKYQPDAYVLAEAIAAEPDWFITHDKAHFLKIKKGSRLKFVIGTAGDLLQALEGMYIQGRD